MKENSLLGGSRNAAAAAPRLTPPARPVPGATLGIADVALLVEAPGAAPRPAVRLLKLPRPGFAPSRPPDRLNQPSTRCLKKSVRMIRFEVMPPCECPTSQNALMFSLPNLS